MRVLFLDQTGKLAGAERVLLDIALPYREDSLVALFEDGPFRYALEQLDIPVKVLTNTVIDVRRESDLMEALFGAVKLVPLVNSATKLAKQHDLVYVNTPKALVVGALASFLSGRPLVYHLHDILTPEHFSATNRALLVALANRFAVQVIAVSEAAKRAFIAAGGSPETIQVVYNGFNAALFQGHEMAGQTLRKGMHLENKFVVGHFSRLSPWKGQHVLLDAMAHCSDHVHALVVGDALFGEDDYVQALHHKVEMMGLDDRVHFLGFRTDVPQLMAACDIITHTSTAPEPCARVLMEAMLSAKPLIASRDGGTVEIVEDGKTGWLVTPVDAVDLAKAINFLAVHPEVRSEISNNARKAASERFTLPIARSSVDKVLRSSLRLPI